jgi:hypothetical protein
MSTLLSSLSNGSSRSRVASESASRPSFASPRTRGGWSADRRTLWFCRACEARLRALRRGLSRSERDLSRRSTVAIFDRGPMPPPPGVKDRSRQRFVRAEPQSLPDGIPDLPRCGSRHNRGTPLLAPSLGSSPEDAPHERGCKSYTPNALRSQYQIQNIVGRKRAAEARYHRVTVAS